MVVTEIVAAVEGLAKVWLGSMGVSYRPLIAKHP